jgi:hypothetical protein
MIVRVLSPFWDRGAGNAVEALMDSLAPKAKVKRSGSWSEIESVDLVAGYMVYFHPFFSLAPRPFYPFSAHLLSSFRPISR